MFNFKAMGQRIREERKLRELTQEQLSEMLDITIEHLSRIETGTSRPSLSMIEKIAAVLEMEESEIMFGTPSDLAESRELLEKIVGLDVEKRRAAEQIINILSGL